MNLEPPKISRARRLRLPRAPVLGLLPSPETRILEPPHSGFRIAHPEQSLQFHCHASADASAPGSHRSGDGGGGVVSSFKTQATPSPSRVDAAPLALRTRARWLFPPPRRRCSQLSEMIGVSNPPRSRRAYSPRPPSAPKRLTPRAPSPLRFPKILPAESWGWGCGCPRSCCCGVR